MPLIFIAVTCERFFGPLVDPRGPLWFNPGMDIPKPRGWQGSAKEANYQRTFDGHISTNLFGDESANADFDARRNIRTASNADIGVEDY